MAESGPPPPALLPSVWRILASGPVVGIVLAVTLSARMAPFVLASSGLAAVVAGLWGASVTVRDEWRRVPVGHSRLVQVVACFVVGFVLLIATGPRPGG